jgi:transcriptional regulator with XRE-family HTH domain
MERDERAIGQRIARHRVRRGLTQDELAGLVGISLSMIKKIESGDRLVTRFSQLVLFAEVLRIKDMRELTGVPLRLAPDERRGHPSADAVYAALLERGRAVGEQAAVGGPGDERRRALGLASGLYQLTRVGPSVSVSMNCRLSPPTVP